MERLKPLLPLGLVLVLFSCKTQTAPTVRTVPPPQRVEVREEGRKPEPKPEAETKVCKPLVKLKGLNLEGLKHHLKSTGALVLAEVAGEEDLKRVEEQAWKAGIADRIRLWRGRERAVLVFPDASCLEEWASSKGIVTEKLKPPPPPSPPPKKKREERKKRAKRRELPPKKVAAPQKSTEPKKAGRKTGRKPRGVCVCSRELPYATKDDLGLKGKFLKFFKKEKEVPKTCASFWTERCPVPKNPPIPEAYEEFDPEDFLFSYRFLVLEVKTGNARFLVKPISILRGEKLKIVNPTPQALVKKKGRWVKATEGRLCGCYGKKYLFLIWKASRPYRGILGVSFLVPRNLRFADYGKLMKAPVKGYIYTKAGAKEKIFYLYKGKVPKISFFDALLGTLGGRKE